ncbi:hypothetical protein [Saprospira grandis]|uniref:hypothetical protein n=1 Tax=Saprospira grandis TaxID=1008 RepID=UPI0022DD115B|nr:hypothetical protein [Saprospira grandis]WBM74900.1 hypothetical protein OP864_01415 [Saprospira grandis]
MSSEKKNPNYLVQEFSSIDLMPKNPKQNAKKLQVKTRMQRAEQEIEFLSEEVLYDEEGRSKVVRHFGPDNELMEEYQHNYPAANQHEVLNVQEGEEAGHWLITYNEAGQILQSVFSDLQEGGKDTDSYFYNEAGQLVKVVQEVFPSDEPTSYVLLDWEGERLLKITELFGDELEGEHRFEYAEGSNLPKKVAHYVMLEEEGEAPDLQMADVQQPKYNEKGQLIYNEVEYLLTDSKIELTQEYNAEEVAVRFTQKEYVEGELFSDLLRIEDGKDRVISEVTKIPAENVTVEQIYDYI